MKKIMILAILLMFMTASMSFAAFTKASATNTGASAGFLDLTGLSTPIGLSPKCIAYYTTTGTDATDTQWYAIGTAHPGGNVAYGTAQDLNNLYSRPFPTNLTTATLAGVISSIPDIPASPSAWDTWANTIVSP